MSFWIRVRRTSYLAVALRGECSRAALEDGSVDEEEAREIFQRFDRDGSQELSLKELTTVVVSILPQLKKKLVAAGANAEVRCTPLP